ncbi:MAG: uracil-xanthine permease [Clostridia bacterium]|nr:uracil-xanthine permease [Clostridia bacterium]
MSQNTNLVYRVNEKPPLRKNLFYALQQLLAIMAATILVPALVNSNAREQLGINFPYMDQAAALCGAGFGTLLYLFSTQRKSPVFLGSSFAFIAPLTGAVCYGFAGIFLGAIFAGLVYVIIAVVMKVTGTAWVNKLLPPVVIGPTVALIGLSLCGSAVKNLNNTAGSEYSLVHIALGIFAFGMTVFASVKGGKRLRMIPFIIGIVSAYIVALLLTGIGSLTGNEALQVVNTAAFKDLRIFTVPQFNFLGMFNVWTNDAVKTAAASEQVLTLAAPSAAAFKNGIPENYTSLTGVVNLLLLFAPVAFVTLAEHIADHKNLSSIIGQDLTTDPGLSRTLYGDGAGSVIGSFFGGCPNTTYGESVGCVAITGNASVSTIFIAAIYCIILSFFGPFTAFVNSIPSCITGGVCIALYGFIAVSGLKMLQPVNLSDNRNLFVVAAILVPGIGGLELKFEHITISATATALILGILVNVIFNRRKDGKTETAEQK